MNGYYRILSPLSYGKQILHANTIHFLRLKEENLNKLIELGLISPINTPPISEIDELKSFKTRLEKLGIYDLKQFLEADHERLNTIWKRKDHLEARKQNLINTYLIIPKSKKCANC